MIISVLKVLQNITFFVASLLHLFKKNEGPRKVAFTTANETGIWFPFYKVPRIYPEVQYYTYRTHPQLISA